MARVISVSADQSQISTDITNPAADGVAVTTVSVSVKQDRDDDNGEPLDVQTYAASNVVLSVSPATGVTITQPTGTSDANGTVTGSFVSTNAATVSVGATAFGATVTGNATVVVGGGAPPTPDPGDPFFTDTFAGGVKTNADGFTWNSTGSEVSVQLAPDASGDYALRFRFGPDPDAPASGSDSAAEQRFNMGRNVTELWIQYSIWIPSNYAHRSQSSGGTNNKFLRIWGDDYNSNFKMGASTIRDTAFSPDNSGLGFEYVYKTSGDGQIGFGGPYNSGNVEYGDAMKGVWTQIRVHLRPISADGADDGLMELWYDGTKVITFANVAQKWDSTRQYWNNGYFFGWANSGFTDETDFYIRGGTNGPKFYETDPGWT